MKKKNKIARTLSKKRRPPAPPDSSVHTHQHISRLYSEGRLEEAAHLLEQSISRHPNDGPSWGRLGVILMELGRTVEAAQAFEGAVERLPRNPGALYNLARLRQIEGELPQAVDLYQRLLEVDPVFALGWNNLGAAYRQNRQPDKARACFEQAVRLAPDMAEAWNNLGVSKDEVDDLDGALAAYRAAITESADYVSARLNAGQALQRAGRLAEAEGHYRHVLQTDPANPTASYLLNSLGGGPPPKAAPVDYVAGLFDACAERFDEILVGKLRYQTPERLYRFVAPDLGHGLVILDLGCGTGLGSELYRPHAQFLVGLDASTGMLEKAKERGTFDRLHVGNLLEPWPFEERFDLIYASDVLVYVGELAPVLASARRFLQAGGLLAFTIEDLPDRDTPYRLFPTGRYAHGLSYVAHALDASGFQLKRETDAVIREEDGHGVTGRLILAQAI